MRGNEWVHEGLEVRSPPLRKRVADLPFIVDAFTCELRADWCKALIQPRLEALDFVVFGAEVVTRSRFVNAVFM